MEYKSEIRSSELRDLLEKVRKQNYGEYLLSLRLEHIRQFQGATINFDFPVTALIGPNGSGKSTILGAAGCIYSDLDPRKVFRKSRIGDEAMDDWTLAYELISRDANPKGTIREEIRFKSNHWQRSLKYKRALKMIGITRTVPAGDNPHFHLRNKLSVHGKLKHGHTSISKIPVENIEPIKIEAEKILGRSLKDFQLFEVTYSFVRQKGGRTRTVESKRKLSDDREEVIWKIEQQPVKKKTLTSTT